MLWREVAVLSLMSAVYLLSLGGRRHFTSNPMWIVVVTCTSIGNLAAVMFGRARRDGLILHIATTSTTLLALAVYRHLRQVSTT